MYLLDINFLSNLRKDKKSVFVAYAASIPLQQMFLSVITIMEIETGILRIRRKDVF